MVVLACHGKPSVRVDGRSESAWQTTRWPMARGGVGVHGRVHDRVPRNPSIAWTHRVATAITTEVALADGLAVFGDDAGVIHALDLATHAERWQVVTGETVEATPAISSGRVFVGSNDGVLRALNLADGKELWHLKGEEKFPTGAIVVRSQDGHDDWVIVNGYDGVTRCLKSGDGSVVWTHQTQDYINGTPVLLGNQAIAFGGCDAVIHTISMIDGSPLRERKTDAQVIRTVAEWHGVIFAVTYANQLLAVDGEKPLWTYEHDGSAFLTIPTPDDELVYVGSRDKHLHAVTRADGKLKWKFLTAGRVESSPLAFDDAVVFGSGDGRLYAVDKRDGRQTWRLDLGESLTNAPSFAAGMIVIGGADGTLFVIKEGQP